MCGEYATSRRTFTSLCFVNKRFINIVLPFLYANIFLDYASFKASKWLKLLNTLETTEAGLAVRRLTCDLGATKTSVEQPDEESAYNAAVGIFFRIYQCCGRLHHLAFTSSLSLSDDLDKRIRHFLQKVNVTSLSISHEWLPILPLTSKRHFKQFIISPWKWSPQDQLRLTSETISHTEGRCSADEIVFRGACWQYESNLLGSMQGLVSALPNSSSYTFINCSRDREACSAIFSCLPPHLSTMRVVETRPETGQARRLDFSGIKHVTSFQIAYTGLVRQWPMILEHLFLEQLDLTTMMELQRFILEPGNPLRNLLTIGMPDTRAAFHIYRGVHYKKCVYKVAQWVDTACRERQIGIFPHNSFLESWKRAYAFDPRPFRHAVA